MKLERLVLVNWGALRSGDYPLGNMTLLTGPTGAGKTTLLDALQTLMSATYPGLYSYNPGQEESSQNTRKGKSKRTLWSYIVGAEDNLFSRPQGAHGYVVGVFQPDEGEDAAPFCAVIGASARVEDNGGRRQAVQERLCLMIVDGAELTVGSLLEQTAEGATQVVQVEAADRVLRKRGLKTTNFQDSKREFLCHLYGRFRGLRSVAFSEAERAARAWCHSIGNRPIGSVDDLIRAQVLEFDAPQFAQRIGQVTDLMRQVRSLRLEGERLTRSIAQLETIDQRAAEAGARYRSALGYSLFAARMAVEADEAKIDGWLKTANKARQSLEALTEDRRALTVSREALQENLIEALAAMQGSPALADQARAASQLAQARAQASEALGGLGHDITQTANLCLWLVGLGSLGVPESIQSKIQPLAERASGLLEAHKATLSELREASVSSQAQAPVEALTHWCALAEQLVPLAQSLFAAVFNRDDGLLMAAQSAGAVLSERLAVVAERDQILRHQRGLPTAQGTPYPNAVAEALGAFAEALPAVRPLVLCDLVEVQDPQWQSAIEGYLGMARFNLIVAPEHEEDAIGLVRARRLRIRVVQGARCLERYRPERVPDESIVKLLHTEHPIARAYLGDAFGDVVRVTSVEVLRKAGRGVMIDGRACGGKALYVVSAPSLVLGAEARKAAALQARNEQLAFAEQLKTLRAQQLALDTMISKSRGLEMPGWRGLHGLRQACAQIALEQGRLERAIPTEEADLAAEIADIRSQLKKEADELETLNREIALLEARAQSATLSAAELQTQVDARRQATDKLEQHLAGLCEEAGARLDEALPSDTHRLQRAEHAHDKAHALEAEALDLCGRVWSVVAEYNREARTGEALSGRSQILDASAGNYLIESIYRELVALREEVGEHIGARRSVGLVRNLDQLVRAEASFKDVFVRQFCYEIRNAVDSGVRSLRALNLELENWKFGADRFSVDWSVWVPEFKDYYSFFVAAHELSETQSDSIFDTPVLGEAEARARDKLLSLMLSSDMESAQAELMRIADYRNYRRYEIWKQSESGARVALSEWGTGSGGQLETPAYIVRAAVVTHRLKCFEPGPSLKLLVNDESFAKMDEQRARSVLHFIRDGLGAQLICAMPTKHAGGLRPEFSREYAFSRAPVKANGEVDFMSEVDARILHTDRLQLLWEQHRQAVRERAAALT